MSSSSSWFPELMFQALGVSPHSCSTGAMATYYIISNVVCTNIFQIVFIAIHSPKELLYIHWKCLHRNMSEQHNPVSNLSLWYGGCHFVRKNATHLNSLVTPSYLWQRTQNMLRVYLHNQCLPILKKLESPFQNPQTCSTLEAGNTLLRSLKVPKPVSSTISYTFQNFDTRFIIYFTAFCSGFSIIVLSQMLFDALDTHSSGWTSSL